MNVNCFEDWFTNTFMYSFNKAKSCGFYCLNISGMHTLPSNSLLSLQQVLLSPVLSQLKDLLTLIYCTQNELLKMWIWKPLNDFQLLLKIKLLRKSAKTHILQPQLIQPSHSFSVLHSLKPFCSSMCILPLAPGPLHVLFLSCLQLSLPSLVSPSQILLG